MGEPRRVSFSQRKERRGADGPQHVFAVGLHVL
jgi:hypothetical protein